MSQGSIYKRILIKLSGESLSGGSSRSLDPDTLNRIAGELKEIHASGTQTGIVVGGGNIFRGLSEEAERMDRVSADHMGMLATVINAIALRDALLNQDIPATVFSAIPMQRVAEDYNQRKVLKCLMDNEVVIFAAGTGNPFFTTDTAAALRAVEIGADALMKGTRVEGIYTADPEKDPSAEFLPRISYDEVLQKNLRVMDQTAFALCRENQLAVHIFNMEIHGNLLKIIHGERIGSVVGGQND